MGSSFFSGLVGSYGNQLLKQQQDQRADEDKQKGTEIQILEAAAAHPDITDDARAAIWSRLGEIASGKKPGAKGAADPLHTAMGHLTGMTRPPGGTQTPAGPTVAPAPDQPTNPPPIDSSMAGAPPPPVSLGNPPAPPTASAAPAPAAQPAPTSQAGTLGAPPQPPVFGQGMFKTPAQKAKEAADNASAAVDASVQARADQEEGYNQHYRDTHNGAEPPEDVKKDNHNFAFYGIHPSEKLTIGKDVVKDKNGNPVHNVFDSKMNIVNQVPAEIKPLKFQQEIENKIQNYMAVNSKKPDETDDQFKQRAELYVRKQQFNTDAQKLVSLGLGNNAKQATIDHLTQLIKNGDIGQNAQAATAALAGARAAARMRKNDFSGKDPDGQNKTMDELTDEELQRLGTSRAEVAKAINTKMRTSSGSKKDPLGIR